MNQFFIWFTMLSEKLNLSVIFDSGHKECFGI